ncbi:hypothetical protein BBA70_03190 [New Jersey aster yellows phytoplasma]|uniref:Uncharacterized protein n=1 Tax=New Jersey aster yellows phytoplasma TaxID=270520 RepID=A0ABX4K0X2_9MOLU|nr:hypothetical protein BBA70_03190 [New Jersey aster yellows phytoplasma]
MKITTTHRSEMTMKMTNSNFTIDFVSGKLFVVGLCFIFKYLFFSFLRLFNPNDNNPIKKKMKPQTQIIKKKI